MPRTQPIRAARPSRAASSSRRPAQSKEAFLERFEAEILSGGFSPGDRLPAERVLADALGVSRPVVHQGILELAAKGLVRLVPRHGAFVNDYRRQGSVELLVSLFNFTWGDQKLTRRLLDSVLEVRVLFETETARLAATRRTEAQLRELEVLLERELGWHELSPEQIAQIDFDIHHLIALSSGNDVYPLLLNSFRPMYLSVLGLFYQRPEVLVPVAGYHRKLHRALAGRDEAAAAAAMGRILRYGEKMLREVLPDGGGGP
jgi:DNA-binding FadR family transcriptional regulator